MWIIERYFSTVKNTFNTYIVGCKDVLIARQAGLTLFFFILLPFCTNAYVTFRDPSTNLEVVNVNPGNSVASGLIRTMEMDHRQVLWMATDDGLYYLDGLIRHHILMVYQELLVNMIKHTNCHEIHIKLVPNAKDLRLTITNTHKGYKNQTEQGGGRGLERIQKRLLVFKGLLNWTEMTYFQEAEIEFPFK